MRPSTSIIPPPRTVPYAVGDTRPPNLYVGCRCDEKMVPVADFFDSCDPAIARFRLQWDDGRYLKEKCGA